LLTGIAVYMAYRRNQGLDLTSTFKVAVPASAVDHEAEYDSVLVAFDERGYAPEVMATAARLAARRRRGIHVLVTISVPATSPIDAQLPELEAAAQSIIEEAMVQVGRRVSGHWEKVRGGQTGRVIIDARAIVMPMTPKGGASPFDRTLETVLRERPCRVIVELTPIQPLQHGRVAAWR
jgi:basic amino acid/polyamine antiporter, APA family